MIYFKKKLVILKKLQFVIFFFLLKHEIFKIDQPHKKKMENRDPNFLRLESFLPKICGNQHVYVYQTSEFWMQAKSAGYLLFLKYQIN